jgi:hypothetical protein
VKAQYAAPFAAASQIITSSTESGGESLLTQFGNLPFLRTTPNRESSFVSAGLAVEESVLATSELSIQWLANLGIAERGPSAYYDHRWS